MITAAELQRHKHRMRNHPTPHERIIDQRLWDLGALFKRQVIVGFYCVDFVLPDRLLVIEVDGPEHDAKKWYDARRDEFLRRSGFRVIHIPHADAESYPLADAIRSCPEQPREFHRCLYRALSLKGIAMRRQACVDAGQQGLF